MRSQLKRSRDPPGANTPGGIQHEMRFDTTPRTVSVQHAVAQLKSAPDSALEAGVVVPQKLGSHDAASLCYIPGELRVSNTQATRTKAGP